MSIFENTEAVKEEAKRVVENFEEDISFYMYEWRDKKEDFAKYFKEAFNKMVDDTLECVKEFEKELKEGE